MDDALAFRLHALTARLDREADGYLRSEQDLSYRRFLVLFMVSRLNAPTQRVLADRLGVTEPSVSRMIGQLVAAGLLDVNVGPGGGNRRHVALTSDGEERVRRCCQLLEGKTVTLARLASVSYDDYSSSTQRLLDALSAGEVQNSGTDDMDVHGG